VVAAAASSNNSSNDNNNTTSSPPTQTTPNTSPTNPGKHSERNATTNATSEAATPTPALECLLCTETLSLYQNPAAPSRNCPCSSTSDTVSCQVCLYRHMTTIWQEATVGSQRPLTCPLGCGQALTDDDIRTCLKHYHGRRTNPIVRWIKWCLYQFLTTLLWLVHPCNAPTTIPGSLESCYHYRLWWYWLHTPEERRDLERYEKWSVASGLKDNPTTSGDDNNTVILQHCPAPDCGYTWMVADPSERRRKQAHEQRRVFLWYASPRPERSPSCQWVEAEFLHFGGRSAPPPPVDWDDEGSLQDGRRMVCAKCHYCFCGLCRQPWKFLQHAHASRSCQAYRRALPPTREAHDVALLTVGARVCPGCHTITSRIDGCNHMTCPCGKEWCYVCGANWNALHYSCRQGPTNAGNPDCVIL